ncbi:bifunctional glycosyltransferase family 2/GtrA family protein [Gryllotalpicola koreensis]|uniref:dolichyl-phosphate beta-glucosyltransferase n=1 Tax=Gryllotalpicola koreensis TaxID=993086 RepID=A0ABP7ZRT8_9MICO
MNETARRQGEPSETPSLDLDIVMPVYNEQATLEHSVVELREFLSAAMPESWRITIADNASTDATAAIADRLAAELDGVRAVHLPQKGRGRALKAVWSDSPARVLAYLDEDLSTDLRALRPLVAPLLSGHSDLAIGTRLARSSRIIRGGKREFISRSYNLMLRTMMDAKFSDAQCGFKAIRSDVARELLPYVEDTGWFFDTELLVLAERSGLRIHEVPVDWIDDPDSSVDIVATATADIKGMWRLSRDLAKGRLPVDELYARLGRQPLSAEAGHRQGLLMQLLSFGLIGGLSTVAYAVLYLVLAHAMPAQAANFVALLVTAIANTAANRRFTFGVRGRSHAATHHAQGLVVFGIAWLITSGSLLGLHAWYPRATAGVEVVTLTAANVVATLLRFVLLRWWVFRRGSSQGVPPRPAVKPLTVPIQIAAREKANQR